MPKPRDVAGVYDVAVQLAQDFHELVEEEWADSAEPRYRSSVSRAYYSVFLLVKARLKAVGHSVPGDNAHGRLQAAMKDALVRAPRIPREFYTLKQLRGNADYDLEGDFTRDYAEERLEEAEGLIRRINTLSEADMRNIGNRL